jgi:hypothetical protein
MVSGSFVFQECRTVAALYLFGTAAQFGMPAGAVVLGTIATRLSGGDWG